MEKREKRILLLDMYGVILKESKGRFIPYTFAHFDPKERDRLTRAFREENYFTRAGNGELSSDAFLSLLGYPNPAETMRDYLTNYLTLDPGFPKFAEGHYRQYDFVLLSNDVREWSKFLLELHGLRKYFQDAIVSGDIRMRKPESRIFAHTLQRLRCDPQDCTLIDNSVQNLRAAQEAGMEAVLFNRDHVAYSGSVVNDFPELARFLKRST